MEAHIGAQLAQIQELISSVRAQLSRVHAGNEQQNLDYQQLMDIKMQLEQEITTYHSPLQGQNAYYNYLPTTKTA